MKWWKEKYDFCTVEEFRKAYMEGKVKREDFNQIQLWSMIVSGNREEAADYRGIFTEIEKIRNSLEV